MAQLNSITSCFQWRDRGLSVYHRILSNIDEFDLASSNEIKPAWIFLFSLRVDDLVGFDWLISALVVFWTVKYTELSQFWARRFSSWSFIFLRCTQEGPVSWSWASWSSWYKAHIHAHNLPAVSLLCAIRRQNFCRIIFSYITCLALSKPKYGDNSVSSQCTYCIVTQLNTSRNLLDDYPIGGVIHLQIMVWIGMITQD